jgi:N-acetylglucosaminyl-diphospho-decaprenol L-rhamnosyltransferase
MSQQIVISIVSHRQGKLVQELLSDLESIQSENVYLVILTLNTPEEPVPEIWGKPTRWGKKLVRNISQQGFGANHNAAFRYALQESANRSAGFLWAVVNPDIRITDTTLFDTLSEAFDDKTFLVAPAVIEKGEIAASARSLYTPFEAIRGYLGYERKLASTPDWIAGMFLVFTSRAYSELKGFDERYFLYCEDVDICLRIQNGSGKILYVPSAHVNHEARRMSHKSRSALRMHLVSAIKLWTSKAFWQFFLGRLLERRS